MAFHVYGAILSLTRFVFMDEEGICKISINTMKEMKKKDRNLVFLKEKLSLFIKRLDFNIFTHLAFLGFVQPLSKTHCHASQLCICVLVDVQWTGKKQSIEIVQLVT